MARFKIVTPAGPGTGVPGADHSLEMEALAAIGAEMALVLSGKWPRACVDPAVPEKSRLERWQPYSMERGPGN